MSKNKYNHPGREALTPEEELPTVVEDTTPVEEEQTQIEGFPIPEEGDEPALVDPNEPEFVTGKVAGCRKLNVREAMFIGAKVLCEIPEDAEVQIFVDEVHDEWFHVITASGVEGFCMKKYISILIPAND